MANSMDVQVAFSDGFFSALTALPPNIQAKVNRLVLKFKVDPTSSGLNYEKLDGVKDRNMRSLRVDQTYRVILSAPEKGNVYLLLWATTTTEPTNGLLIIVAASIQIPVRFSCIPQRFQLRARAKRNRPRGDLTI